MPFQIQLASVVISFSERDPVYQTHHLDKSFVGGYFAGYLQGDELAREKVSWTHDVWPGYERTRLSER